MRANENHPFSNYWRRCYTSLRGIAPQLCACTGCQGIERMVKRADVDLFVDDEWRGEDAVVCAVVPQFFASNDIKRIHSLIVRPNQNNVISNVCGRLNSARS